MGKNKALFPTFAINADKISKEDLVNSYIRYMLVRTQSMFEYKGLPDTLPAKWLEFYLQTNGNAFITKVDGNLYAFTGGLGGKPDAYYLPTIYTVANPALNFTKECKIGEDGVLIYNDASNIGLVPLLSRYAALMAENYISMRIAIISARSTSLISASDDTTKRSAEEYIRKLIEGELSIVGENTFFDGVKVQPTRISGQSAISELIEMQQYLKASMYNEIGLQSNYNMKREAINATESQMNDDMLKPLVDDMLQERQNAVEEINKMFDTEISVDLASAWKMNEQEEQLEIEAMYNQLDSNEQSKENDEGDGDNGKDSSTD